MESGGLTMSQTITDDLQTLKKIGTNLVFSALGGVGALDGGIAALWPGAKLCGPAFPVECMPADKLMVNYAILNAEPGDVIVAATKGVPQLAYFGRIMATVAAQRGLAGIVIDGCVRDSEPLEELGFPVFCRGIDLKGTRKTAVGRHSVPITLAGQTIAPGDVVVGDRDGVVVIPKGRLAEVVSKAKEKYEAEMVDAATIGSDLSSPEFLTWKKKAVAAMGE
jgi:4-hydroxy-4-methyl-2-oxoglutarate aldolase